MTLYNDVSGKPLFLVWLVITAAFALRVEQRSDTAMSRDRGDLPRRFTSTISPNPRESSMFRRASHRNKTSFFLSLLSWRNVQHVLRLQLHRSDYVTSRGSRNADCSECGYQAKNKVVFHRYCFCVLMLFLDSSGALRKIVLLPQRVVHSRPAILFTENW